MRTLPKALLVIIVCVLSLAGCSYRDGGRNGAGAMAPVPPSAERERELANALSGLIFEEHAVLVDPALAGEAGSLSEGELLALLDEAEGYLARGRAIRALTAFTQAIIAAPDRATSYEGLARGLIREGKPAWAQAAYETALDLEPTWLEVRFAVGNTLARQGKLEEAMDVWRRVAAENPALGDVHGRLATGYYLLGLYDLSRTHLQAAAENGGAYPAHLPAMLDTGEAPRAQVVEGFPAGDAPEGSPLWIGSMKRINSTGGTAPSNETSCIAVDGAPLEAIAAWNDSRNGYQVGAAITLDGGETWTDFVIEGIGSYCDPLTAADPRTSGLWVGGLDYSLNVFVTRKQPGTTILEPHTYAGNADKPWLAAGHLPRQADTTRMYMAANIDFSYSDDLGQTWVDPGVSSSMSGIGHLPRVGPGGELYVAYWDLGWGVKMQRSLDGGQTLSTPITIATRLALWDIYDSPQVPGGFRVPPLSYLAVDPNNGTLYCVYFDVTGMVGGNYNADLYLTLSHDRGTTWSTPKVINGDSDPPGDQFFPWIEADSQGRLHLLYLDTRHTQQNDTAATAYLDAYYAWSEDGGDTWTEHRLTQNSFNTGATSDFLGDYLGMGVGHGRAYPIYPYVSGSLHQIVTNQIVWQDPTVIFADGFESGDTSAWSLATP